jgi:hypothetical protein
MVHGYAAQKDGFIDIKTVSDTQIAAMVNWLCCDGVLVLRGTPDERVREIWEDNRRGTEIVPVIIQQVQ